MLGKWMKKNVDASWEKVIETLKSMSQNVLANQLKKKYCTSESNPPATAIGLRAESSLERELLVDRQEFLEMEDLERKYLQLVLQAESAVEETNPTVRKITRFSQCFLSGGIASVEELFNQFYFLDYALLEMIVKFFLPRAHEVADNFCDYLQQLANFKSSTTV